MRCGSTTLGRFDSGAAPSQGLRAFMRDRTPADDLAAPSELPLKTAGNRPRLARTGAQQARTEGRRGRRRRFRHGPSRVAKGANQGKSERRNGMPRTLSVRGYEVLRTSLSHATAAVRVWTPSLSNTFSSCARTVVCEITSLAATSALGETLGH